MKALKAISILVIAVAAFTLVARMLVIRIEPGQVGVVNAEWTGGLVEKDFGPGYHLNIGPMHTWTVFDTTVQTLHMNRDPERAGRVSGTDVRGPLRIKSQQGATITLDVTLKYRIKPGAVWQLFKEYGTARGYKEKVENIANRVLLISLGGLQAEDFYGAKTRQEVVVRMDRDLGEQLDKQNVELVAILIRDLEFDKGIEERIKEKTLATERQKLNQAQNVAEEKKGLTRKVEAETNALLTVIVQEKEKTIAEMKAENDKQVASITADFRKKVQELESDADLYAALKDAEGIKLRREAEARGQALRRAALAGLGGQILVALELARNLKLGEMSISTQAVNPFDIDAMMERLGARQ